MIMNVAIIGCGYVGYAVAKFWRQNPSFRVTVTTTSEHKVSTLQEVADAVEVTMGDDQVVLNRVLKNQDVVLLAVGAKSSSSYEKTYLETAKTVTSLIKYHPKIKQLIYTSSYAIYGDRNGVWVDEETPPAPPNLNSQILGKTEEILLAAATENLRVCILRLGGIYGPGRELIKIFSRTAGTTREGNGEEITNWVHLDDIVRVVEFARWQRLQGIYNLVDDSHFTSRELIDGVLKTHNLPNVIWDATNKSTRQYNTWVSNQKLKDAGYQFIHSHIVL